MLLKAVLVANAPAVTVIMLGLLGTQSDTNMVKLSKQLVEWYREIITQLADN